MCDAERYEPIPPGHGEPEQISRRVRPQIETRILRALDGGPLYRPALELIVGSNGVASTEPLKRMTREGLIEIATDIGPATYRLTNRGRAR